MDVTKLIEGLGHTDPGVREAAVAQMGSLGAATGMAVSYFRHNLEEHDRNRIVHWIGELGPAAAPATEFLLVLATTWESLEHGDQDAIDAVRALEQVAGEVGVETLSGRFQQKGIWVLGYLRQYQSAAVPYLVQWAQRDDDLAVTQNAIWALAELSKRSDSAWAGFQACCRSTVGAHREAAARFLATTRHGRPYDEDPAFPLLLLELLGDVIDQVRMYALFGLDHWARAKPDQISVAIARIQQAFEVEECDGHREQILRIVHDLAKSEKTDRESLLRWLLRAPYSDSSDHVRRSLIELIAEHFEFWPAAAVLPALLKALEDASSDVRSAALGALGIVSQHVLVRALADESTKVRVAAARGLGLADTGASAVNALAGAIRDVSPAVRRSAARALAELGPLARSAVPDLIEAFRHANTEGAAEAADMGVALLCTESDIGAMFEPVVRRLLEEIQKCHSDLDEWSSTDDSFTAPLAEILRRCRNALRRLGPEAHAAAKPLLEARTLLPGIGLTVLKRIRPAASITTPVLLGILRDRSLQSSVQRGAIIVALRILDRDAADREGFQIDAAVAGQLISQFLFSNQPRDAERDLLELGAEVVPFLKQELENIQQDEHGRSEIGRLLSALQT